MSIPATQKAEVLLEALPYIHKFRGSTFVVKYGGSFMDDPSPEGRDRVATDIAFLAAVGIQVVVVHGGGKAITRAMDKAGIKSEFRGGMRVTDAETMDIVEMVLGGQVNKEIVNLINQAGGKAVGLTGKDASFIRAKKLLMQKLDAPAGDLIDVGQVGEITSIDPSLIAFLDQGDFIPVIAPIGVGENGGWSGGLGANKKGAIVYHDISATWQAPWNGSVTVGARNVFGKTPPITYAVTNASAVQLDPMLDYDRFLFIKNNPRF